MEALGNHARIVAILSVLAVLAVFAAPGVRADVNKPTWSTGDYWEYAVTGNTYYASGNGTMKVAVVGPDTVTVAGISYATYHTKFWANVTQGSLTITVPGDIWFQTSDLAIAKTSFSLSYGGSSFTVVAESAPPQGIQWPLTAGKSWNVASVVTTTTTITGNPPQTSSGSVSGAFTVQAAQSIQVPAGTFNTMPVKASAVTGGSGYAIAYFSEQVGAPARSEAYDQNNQQQGSAQLTKYNYQAGGGLSALLWIFIILAIVIVALIAAGLMMRRRKRPAGMPPSVPGQAWQQQPPGWQGQPPQQGWQQPPQQPQQPWQPPPQGPP